MKLSSLARSPVVAAALFFAGIALLQFGGPGWSQAVYKWSQTPGVNASVDPAINWAEGQAPSSVNDSARATMAGVAKWRDDLNGTVVTTNGPNAYSLASNQVLGSFTIGHRICFSPNQANAAIVTVNVDGLGNKPLRSSPNTELGASILLQGTPYCATYFGSNGGEYILDGFYGTPFNVPLGAIFPYVGTLAPSTNFALPAGQTLSCTTYAALFAVMGSALYGGGCSGPSNLTGTFNIPDLRGRTIFGVDNMAGQGTIGRITQAATGFNPLTIGAAGGSQLIAGRSALPNTTIGVPITDSSPAGGDASILVGSTSGSGTVGSAFLSSNVISGTSHTLSAQFNLNNNVTQTATLPPSIILPYILRIF